MKAVVYERYGSPDVLRVADVPVPDPGDGQVLLKVAATSINLSDWECLRGSPLYARVGGLRAPQRRTLGSDVAGTIEAVGAGVTRFVPGDEVYGDNLDLKGGFAEYVVVPEAALALKPAERSRRYAAVIPDAGLRGESSRRRVRDRRSWRSSRTGCGTSMVNGRMAIDPQ